MRADPQFKPSHTHHGKESRTMPLPNSSIFGRDDTLLGICEGLAQDLRINPLWLRLAFLPFLFVFPAQTIGAYLTIGAAVWLSRTLFPAQLTPAASSTLDAAAPVVEQLRHPPAGNASVSIAA